MNDLMRTVILGLLGGVVMAHPELLVWALMLIYPAIMIFAVLAWLAPR